MDILFINFGIKFGQLDQKFCLNGKCFSSIRKVTLCNCICLWHTIRIIVPLPLFWY